MASHVDRKDPRVRSRGSVLLITEAEHRIPATIYDVSHSGMRVETAQELASGLLLKVEVHGCCAVGVVRHCVRNGDNYHVGLSLHDPGAEPDPG